MSDLSEETADPNPFRQFAEWYQAGLALDITDPNAMTLATATPDGRPSARMVLLKGFDERGFVFYSNYESRKGRELRENPYAALILYWRSLRRQIRIEGTVERVSPEESDAYFASRARGSQLGAAASRQSTTVPNRTFLEERVAQLSTEYEGQDVPRPEYWGGYRVRATRIEFWEGKPDRLHNRIQYTMQTGEKWAVERLSP